MARSNYERWESNLADRPVAADVGYVAPARGAGRRWRNRHGVTVEVMSAELEKLDADGMPWLACCVDHGALLAVPTKASGVSACRDTTEFCDECRGALPRQDR